MKVSHHWLQHFFPTPALPGRDPDQGVGVYFPSAEKLADALTFHTFEIDGIEVVGDDQVLDVKVTPNRGHDCLSHRGIAKEVSAILNIPLVHDPLQETPVLAPTTEKISVSIEDATLCKRYIAGYLRGVKVGPSPEWLTKNLEALCQRSINNVVDATNFVMLNVGQPLHAFDAGKLEAKDGTYAIAVRRAKAGEKMLALDEKEYTLNESMLVIADAHKNEVIGIAGIKGGMPAGITSATTDIILESANFDGVSVRKTAQNLKLRTDASQRFEQVLSPELAAYGMHAVVELIQKIAGGEVVGFVDEYPGKQQPQLVAVTVEKINQVLGSTLTGADVADVFTRLQFGYKEEAGVFEVHVPFERLDLTIAEDLVEEVGRIVGYDKIPTVPLPPFSKTPEVNKNYATAEHVRESLVTQGYSEVFTSVFADRGERAVLNKIDSVKPYLRATLVDGLSEVLKKNIPNKDLLGLKEIKLFEIGTVWHGGKEILMVGVVSEKPARPDDSGRSGGQKPEEKLLDTYIQSIEPTHYENLPTSTAQRYKPFSKYPYIVRDIAMWVSGVSSDEVLKLTTAEAGELLVRSQLFDQFQKEGRTSYAFRLIFQSFERTLTEVEVNQIMEKISATLKTKGFEIR